MKLDRDSMTKKVHGLKGKAKKARAEGKRAIAKAFKKGARKITRKLKGLPKLVAKKAEEAAS